MHNDIQNTEKKQNETKDEYLWNKMIKWNSVSWTKTTSNIENT
jgi:hypothetical protein